MNRNIFSFLARVSFVAIAFSCCPITMQADSTDSTYTVTVNEAGTFGQKMLSVVDNWSNVKNLTVIGHLNSDDMAFFSRMTHMQKLDLSQTDIAKIGGCASLPVLKEVLLPTTVTAVDRSAFSGCVALKNISLPNVIEIGSSAFSGCTGFSSLSFPKAVTIGSGAFLSSSVSSISLPEATSLETECFSKSSIKSIYIPKVKYLGNECFYCCYQLLNIDLSSCTQLGINDSWNGCFKYCRNLQSVILGEGLEAILGSCFYNCVSLTNINFPSTLKTIGSRAFEGCSLTSANLPEGLTAIYDEAFNGCPLTAIHIPSTIQTIGYGAFQYSKKTLKDVYCSAVSPIVTSTFNSDMVLNATLHVPAFSVSAYKLDDNWFRFGKVEALDGDLTDITISNNFNILEYTGLADKANLTLTSVSSPSSAAHLTVNAGSAFAWGNYIQDQNMYYTQNEYYDENHNYVYKYTYPYMTTMIPQSDMTAETVTTRMSLRTSQWSFISLPYDVNVADIQVEDSVKYVIRRYSGENRAAMTGNTWVNLEKGDMLNAGEGYILHCINEGDNSDNYADFTFPAVNNANKNNLFSHENVSQTLAQYPSEFATNRSWNLIGNPYPCYFKANNIEIDAPITVWNGSGYTAYSLADDEYTLRPNEAFFVQCPVSSSTMIFNKEGRTHEYTAASNTDYYYTRAHAKAKAKGQNRVIYNFTLGNGEYSDRTRLVLNPEASVDYEITCDASKFMSSNMSVPQIYMLEQDERLAIDERPMGDGIFALGFYAGAAGEYTIKMNAETTDDVILKDSETGREINLQQEGYTFNAEAGSNNARFTISINTGVTSIESISANESQNTEIYTIDGKQVQNTRATGVYLMKRGNSVKKVMVK